jgi:hypothetical protein
MAATNGMLQFANAGGGLTSVSMYFAGSDAVGSNIRLNKNGIATSTSNVYAKLDNQISAVKVIAGPATGTIKLWWGSHPVGFFNLADHQAGNTANNYIPLNLPAGAEISVEVIATCAA